MTRGLLLDNVVPWLVQLSVLSLIGTALPVVLRIRHPRTQLMYGYALLVACLALPLLQPRDAARSSVRDLGASPFTAVPWLDISLSEALLWALLAGALVQFVRLLVGLLQVRRYRTAATPLFPVPEPVEEAAALVGARAVVCLSSHVSSPATIGLFRPVILLPTSFLELDEHAQRAVVCHELLHVRRGDGLAAMAESVVGALLWFPPISWLIAEIRLAREQVVDAEVVRLTSAREPYIHALLDVAGGFSRHEGLPAPFFLRRRHLTQRVHALLDEGFDSVRRLSVCYASTAVILTFGTWLTVASFPLVGIPVRVEAAAIDIARSFAPSDADRAGGSSIQPASPSPASPFSAAPAAAPALPQPREWEDPITGPITIAASPAARARALDLLERARQNGNLHIAGTPPFHLEVSFEASGDVLHAGSGTLTETWLSGQRWRWTASLSGYSQVRIGSGTTGYDDVPVTSVPVRVHMLRGAIFAPVRQASNVRLRLAPGRAQSVELMCVLLGPHDSPDVPVRLWHEDEYCVDGDGLLRVHSRAPGAYTHYLYSPPLRFGGRVLPSGILMFIAGHEVLQARLAIGAAGSPDEELFTPSPEMVSRGLGLTLARVPYLRLQAPGAGVTSGGPAVVHAAIDGNGRVLEAEVVHGDPQLAPAALEIVKRHPFPATGTQRDAYVGVDFGADVRAAQ